MNNRQVVYLHRIYLDLVDFGSYKNLVLKIRQTAQRQTQHFES
jgi:hypothetical protein